MPGKRAEERARRLEAKVKAGEAYEGYLEGMEYLRTPLPEGPPLKYAPKLFMWLDSRGCDARLFTTRDGQDGFAEYLDSEICGAKGGVIEISEDGDYARNPERVAMYRRKVDEGVVMQFMLNYDVGWKDMLHNVRELETAGAEVRHLVPGKPWDGSNFGVIDDRLFFCITRQPAPDSDVQKVYGEPQPEKSKQADLSGKVRDMMNYTMVSTTHPAFIVFALEQLNKWWDEAEPSEAAKKRLAAYHQHRDIITIANGKTNGNGHQ